MNGLRPLTGLLALILLLGGCATYSPPSPDGSRASISTREASLNHPTLPDRASLYVFSQRTFEHDPPAVTLTLNGETLGSLGDNQYFRLALDPGTHRLAIGSCPDVYRCGTETLTLRAGEARHLEVRVTRHWSMFAPIAQFFEPVGTMKFRGVSGADDDMVRNNILVHARRYSFRREMIR